MSNPLLRLIKHFYYSGRDKANAEILDVRSRKGTAAAMDYAHERHEQCDRTMNRTSKSDRYSFSVGQAGAFGYFAANGSLMPHPHPYPRKGRRSR